MVRGSSRGVKESPVAEKSKKNEGMHSRNVTGVREAGVQGRKEKERGQHFG